MIELFMLCLLSQVPPGPPPNMSTFAEEDSRLVVMLTLPGCAPCKVLKPKLEAKYGAILQIHDLREWNKKVEPALQSRTAPTVFAWKDRTKRGSPRMINPSIDEIEEYFNGSAEQVARGTGRGQWTWPGGPSVRALELHLARPPHNMDSAVLRQASDAELIQIHDNWHNSRRVKARTVRRG